MHKKAWDLVGDYVSSNLEFFTGKSIEAESTVLPALGGWIKDTLSDIPESLTGPTSCVSIFWGGLLLP